MESTRYRREGNTILFSESENLQPAKVAVINKAGVLQPSKGMGSHLDAIKAFLADIGDKIEPPAAEDPPKPVDTIRNFATLEFAEAFIGRFGGSIEEDGPRNVWQVRNTFKTADERTSFERETMAWLQKQATEDPDDIIPPCPAEDPAAGDKTPAVIAWWHRYHPQEAAIRYKGRRFTMPGGI